MIQDARRLRASLESQFAQPIVQKVILSDVSGLSSVRPVRTTRTVGGGLSTGNAGKFAVGLNRVPYDNFPALLHRNERVLTASQANQTEQRPITITFGDIALANGDPPESDVLSYGTFFEPVRKSYEAFEYEDGKGVLQSVCIMNGFNF